MPDVLEEQRPAGREDHQIDHGRDGASRKVRGEGFPEEEGPHPAPGPEKGELEGGDEEDVPPLGVFVHRHDMGSKEEPAHQREGVAGVDAQRPALVRQGDHADAHHADNGGQNIPLVRTLAGDDPV